MWWLSFIDGSVVIMTAASLAQARLLAAAKGLGRASHFVEGTRIEVDRLPPIPEQFVGRILSPVDARQLLEVLRQSGAGSAPQKPRTGKPRRGRV